MGSLLTLLVSLAEWRKMRTAGTEFKGLVEHLRLKRQADIRDHPIVEVNQQLLISIGADALCPKMFAVAWIYHVMHLFPSTN